MKNKLLIIDLSNFIFRAFYGIKPLFNKDGFPTNSIFGVSNMIFNLIRDLDPSHVIVAIDSNTEKERRKLYSEYKKNRSSPPDDLKKQIPEIIKLLNIMNFCCIEHVGYEADDVIGTIALKEKDNFNEVIIASGDKDLMQLVSGNVFLYDSMKKIKYDQEAVINKFEIEPSKIIDYLSLIGDKSDNIPGVMGIGKKGAVKLLTKYETLDNVYNNIDDIKPDGVRNKLKINKDMAFLSQKLVLLVTDLSLDYKDKYRINLSKDQQVFDFLQKYNLYSVIKKLNNL